MSRRLLVSLPEFYLFVAAAYYWIATSLWNPIAIGLVIIIGYQLVFKKRFSGIFIATLFLLLNLYMVLALISELSEFMVFSSNLWKLLIGGSLFLGLNLTAGVAMLFKYSRQQVVVS